MEESLFDLEMQVGEMARNPEKWPATLTLEAFKKLVRDNPGEFHGVNYSDRVKFLQDNGYEITRDNMMDSRLSAKQR